MVTAPGAEIPIGQPAQAPRHKRELLNDVMFSLEGTGAKEQTLKVAIIAQKARVREFIDLYKGVIRMPVHEQCGLINHDVVAVEQKIKDALASLAPTDELANYFTEPWNRREYYRLASIWFMQLHLVAAIGTTTAWYLRSDESGLTETEATKNLSSLFLKLESWLQVEETLLKVWI